MVVIVKMGSLMARFDVGRFGSMRKVVGGGGDGGSGGKVGCS